MLLTRFVRCVHNKTPKIFTPLIQNSWKRAWSVRRIHTRSTLNAKLFVDRENQFAHRILEKSALYNVFKHPGTLPQSASTSGDIDDIISPDDSRSPSEIAEDFKRLVLHCRNAGGCISEEKYDKFVDVFSTNCHNFTDEQLLECLKYLCVLPPTPGINVRNFVEVWSALDAVCMARIENWSVDEVLLCCDYWYGLNLARACEFVWTALRKLGRKKRKLNQQQLVHTMFFCNVVRKAIVEMFDFEVALNECIDNLSINEIGIMCMGFFKTSTPIRNPELIEKLYRRITEEINTAEDITLVNVLKALRYSSKLPQAEHMNVLMEKLSAQVDRLSVLSCLHVALLGTNLHFYHEECMAKIVAKFNDAVKHVRLKDMERITFVICLFDFRANTASAELCQKILVELKNRVDEVIRFPRCFPNCLHFLSTLGYYDEELISAALDEKYIKHVYGSNVLTAREIFCLDSFAQINLKGTYSGNLLTEKKRKTMGKCLSHYIPERNSGYRLSATDKILLEIKETCDHLYRPCYLKHILPHFQRADVIINYDTAENKVLLLSKNCPEDYTGAILTRDLLLDQESSGIKTVVLVVAGWNSFIRSTNQHTGPFKLKLQQLELLGHTVAVIPWHEWRELETSTDRVQYLKRILSPLVS